MNCDHSIIGKIVACRIPFNFGIQEIVATYDYSVLTLVMRLVRNESLAKHLATKTQCSILDIAKLIVSSIFVL